MNRLAGETSPYLLQHSHNPVDWWPWGPDAFAEAKATGKPVLLSIGYSACHWCHVMAHESFEAPGIAARMNEGFVNIKVDREEHPDIDHIYQTALALLGQQGGWPLTMFADSDGKPFFGGTYFPPESRWGRLGFPDILDRVRAVWMEEPQLVGQNRTAIMAQLDKIQQTEKASAPPAEDFLDSAVLRLHERLDLTDGGMRGAPKFPQPYLFELFLRRFSRSGDAIDLSAVTKTLDALCEGGIYDHLGGGFARYSTDTQWLVPHFEKMLYDNALLLKLLAHGFVQTGNPLYKARAAGTVRWLFDTMREPCGAFAASIDADSEGEEGKYYLWSAVEIDQILGSAAPRFKMAYGVTPAGNFEERNILHRRHADAPAFDDEELALCRKRLLEVRSRRIPPGKDGKILTDWNAMAIEALAFAGMVFGEKGWIAAAREAYEFLATALWRPSGRLAHSWHSGRIGADGLLDDYAWLAAAALQLYQASGEEDDLDDARQLAELAEAWFSSLQGGYFQSPAPKPGDAPLILRPRHSLDAAVPSGNAVMMQVLAALYHLTGSPVYAARAERTAAAFLNEAELSHHIPAGMLNGLDSLRRGRSVTLPDSGWIRHLTPALDPRTFVKYGEQAIVCHDQRCSQPLTGPAAVLELLSKEYR